MQEGRNGRVGGGRRQTAGVRLVHNKGTMVGKGGWFGAEEVPRWFGLSVVLVYLVGLGAVAHFGIRATRREAAAYAERTHHYALKSLADRLSVFFVETGATAAAEGAVERAMCEFAATIPVHSLRVVDAEGRIVASSRPSETGSHRPSGSSVADTTGLSSHFARVSLSGHAKGHSEASATARLLFLEAEFPTDFTWTTGWTGHAPTLSAVSVVLGAFFVLYRRLRSQMRGIHRVADRLQTHRDRIEEDLSSLRIADTLDGVTGAWNRLIDSAQSWLEAVQRTDANAELARVLQRNNADALAEALNAVPDGILVITQEVRFEYLNSTICRLMRWRPEEAKQTNLPEAKSEGIGQGILDLIRAASKPDGTFEAKSQVLEAGDRDGGSYRVEILPLHRPAAEGSCVVVVRDVSQQLRSERAREDFVTQVTHELRTPLTNIRAYTETLASGLFEDPKVLTDCYNVITKETRRLSRLIEDILSVSQLEVGSIELQWNPVDPKALLTDGVRDVRGLADEKNIDLQLALPAKLEPIRADRDKLAVVLNNLLGNAIKYTPKDGNVVVGCQISAEAVLITVKDNGLGIDPADHARIFEKFQRGSDAAALAEPGTGIGLYTAREIVRRHGGDIEVMSEKGMGSTFLVRLPHRAGRATPVAPS